MFWGHWLHQGNFHHNPRSHCNYDKFFINENDKCGDRNFCFTKTALMSKQTCMSNKKLLVGRGIEAVVHVLRANWILRAHSRSHLKRYIWWIPNPWVSELLPNGLGILTEDPTDCSGSRSICSVAHLLNIWWQEQDHLQQRKLLGSRLHHSVLTELALIMFFPHFNNTICA